MGTAAGVNPWAGILGTVMRQKPHKQGDPAYQQLLKMQEQDGRLKLMHFRRVKQVCGSRVFRGNMAPGQFEACCVSLGYDRSSLMPAATVL